MQKRIDFSIIIAIISFTLMQCDKIVDTSWKELKNCPEQPYVDYMGKRYETVKIGDQCWLAKNLDVGIQILHTESNDSGNNTIEKYCYDNLPENCNIYGALYSWHEAMQYNTELQKYDICPIGWHVPNAHDWNQLKGYVSNDASKMKLSGNSFWQSEFRYQLSNNASGFSAKPAGFLENSNEYWDLNISALFLSKDVAITTTLRRNDNSIHIYSSGVKAASVRCIKSNQPPDILMLTDDEINDFPLNGKIQWRVRDEDSDPISVNFLLMSVQAGGEFALIFEGIRESEVDLSGKLDYGTLYKWKIQVTDNLTVVESEPRVFVTVPKSCSGIEDVYYAGRIYTTVQIGIQCWMRQSLDVGEMIPLSQTPSDNGIIEKYCFDDDPENCRIFGALYRWDEIMNYSSEQRGQGICPPGWHVPNNLDWNLLISYLGNDVGGKLKHMGTEFWKKPNTKATNESGLSFLPNSSNRDIVSIFSSSTGVWNNEFRCNTNRLSSQHNVLDTYTQWSSCPNVTVRCIKSDY